MINRQHVNFKFVKANGINEKNSKIKVIDLSEQFYCNMSLDVICFFTKVSTFQVKFNYY